MSGIYIHIPFCERKCFYCDFYSIADLGMVQDFISMLSKELTLSSKINKIKNVDTIYFGGGTPSVINPVLLEKILNDIVKLFPVNSGCEISIECNPNSLSSEKLKNYSGMGINRISLGVQSFIDDELLFLRRLHNSDEARRAIENIFASGYKNVSLDLIYAIPGSNMETLEYNLSEVVKYKPQHISAYNLIYEEGTPLTNESINGTFERLPESMEGEMYAFVMNYLQKNGYGHYEVSNYALRGYESIHNSNYWNHTEYFGFGPSAHSFNQNRRSWNYSDLRKYIQTLNAGILPIENEEILTDEMLYEEMVFLGLRSRGIDIKEVNRRFNIDFLKKNGNIITTLSNEGFIILEGNLVRLSDKGFLLCDEICAKLI